MIYDERNGHDGTNEPRNTKFDFVDIHAKYNESYGNNESNQVTGEKDIATFSDYFSVDFLKLGRQIFCESLDGRVL